MVNQKEEQAIQEVTQFLDNLNISYTLHHHPPVFTVEEAERYWAGIPGAHCKNLFLRNKKGKRHYLVIALSKRRVDLKKLTWRLGEDRLSFASPERLQRFLALSPGAVSPFGLIHDQSHAVKVILDESLRKAEFLSFHPNTNTATLTLSRSDFERFLKFLDYPVTYLPLE
jgi:Ala-tRNA(Pro) deacylase